MEKKRLDRTLEKLKTLGVDTSEMPVSLRESAYEIETGSGVGRRLEIGFILNEDLDLIRELAMIIPPIKLVTSKLELLELRNDQGEDHVGFTHINPYWEDNVFYCLYALPAKYANDHL